MLIDATLRANAHLWGKYPPVNGTAEFRAAAGGWLNRRYGLPHGLLDPEVSLLPVAGTREALFLTALLTVPERKNGRPPLVLLPNPFYAVYEGAGLLAGAETKFLPACSATGFLPDLEALPPEDLARTALFYLCSPGNPQGAAADAGYFARALTLARQYGFVLAVDECYSEIYTDKPPVGALQIAAALGGVSGIGTGMTWSNLLVFHSLSKRSNAAGLRSGFVAGDPELIALFSRLRSYANAGTPLPVLAAAAALWNDETHVETNRMQYRAKFAAASAVFGDRFGFYRPDGGFFLWLDVGCGEEACLRLWKEAAVRVLPGTYLSHSGPDGRDPGYAYIRVALVHDTEMITEACARMSRVL